jgi:hypothetical protein
MAAASPSHDVMAAAARNARCSEPDGPGCRGGNEGRDKAPSEEGAEGALAASSARADVLMWD